MRIHLHDIMEECIESGLNYAIFRLFKHRDTETITEEELKSHVDDMVVWIMDSIQEVVTFDPDGEELK